MVGVAYGEEIAKVNRVKVLKSIFLHLLFFRLFYICAKANVIGVFFAPFGIALLQVLAWINVCNPFILGGSFFVATNLAGMNLETLYISAVATALLFVLTFIFRKLKKNIRVVYLYISTILSEILFVYFNASSPRQTAVVIIFCLISLVFLYCCLCFAKGTIIRGFSNKLNVDEKICGGVVLVILGMGLTSLNFFYFEPIKFVAAISILISLKVFSKTTTIIIGALFGVGYAIMFLNPTYIASFVLYAIMALAFNSNLKFLSALSVLLTEIVFGFYFKTYEFFEWQSMLSVGMAGLIYVCLPQKVFNHLCDLLGGFKNKIAVRSVVNRSKEKLCAKTNSLSEIFSDMNNVFRASIKGKLPEKDAKEMIVGECIQKVCNKCGECGKCMKLNRETTMQILNNLVEIGFERGRITLLDIPQYLSSRCFKLNFLVSTLNQLFNSYKNYSNMIGNMDSSKILIADQLGGVSVLLKKLSEEINQNITFDYNSENRIMEDLLYNNINCDEVVVFENNVSDKNVSLIVQNKTYDEKKIEKCVSKACRNKMRVESVQPSKYPNMSEVQLSVKPKHDVVFGSVTRAKDGTRFNGDSHSLIKLGKNRYMVAICDGMGSGINAKKASNQTISLIEDFYKVGFDNETILNSVNRLLTLSQEETYSTLDLCVLDLNNSIGDFIKLGCPNCYIKRKDETEVVAGSSLPIGILEEMRPNIESRVISDFDMLVFVSDGVSDAFDKYGNLQLFINNEQTINPQTLSEKILDKAIEFMGGECLDDLTVMCVRVFPCA